MATAIKLGSAVRRSFAKIQTKPKIPSLIEIQRQSYERFLQTEIAPRKRKNTGLQAAFDSVFPIRSYNEAAALEFVSYRLGQPKYSVRECCNRSVTYAAPLYVSVRLVIWDESSQGSSRAVRDVKEQEVYFGEVPLMTELGTFIINGSERVVVSQLHRSPGVFFDSDKGNNSSGGKLLYNARIIPYRGSWLDFEFDHKDLLHCRIDRRRKFPATVLLRALGYGVEELLSFFYRTETLLLQGSGKYAKQVDFELLSGQRATQEVLHPKTGEVIVAKSRKFTRMALEKMRKAGVKTLPLDSDEIEKLFCAKDIVDRKSGEVLLRCNERLQVESLEKARSAGLRQVPVLFIDGLNVGSYLRDTLEQDRVESQEEAVLEIYRRMRPGDPPNLEIASGLFHNLFFNSERYDLSEVGRLKLNQKFGLEEPLSNRVLTKQDLLGVVRYLIDLRNGNGSVDDIDHLGNRRVRSVGELLENQYRIGLVRMERVIKERMSVQEMDAQVPYDLINTKPVVAAVKEFFGSSQLSQFMDQVNPLAEVTHKRRLSALGPGGLTRDRASFEVRDVHPTHYGRICPVETPEGPNIGLIASLSTYARINAYGFVETPYRRVKDGRVTGEVAYYTALQEENEVVAPANTPVDKKTGRFLEALVQVRKAGEPTLVRSDQITLMDVSPNQLVSIAAGLIPFLEHDDANRALMGSNMQRQAVPLLRSCAPLVGTGMESVVARDSGVCCLAKHDGIVDYVDASRIVVRAEADRQEKDDVQVDVYQLGKYRRTNQSTCFNQKPLVRAGDRVQRGDVLADGPSTVRGELALGQNVVVAFMPWQGYNFEDSILISERLLKEDCYTSIHIEEHECIARDTKLGPEEITPDIPNVSEDGLHHLDGAGIVRVGAHVKPGDILVGKVTPKGETQLSPEEKLLRAIFGEKAGDVRDTSLRMPPGASGTVIRAEVFTRKGLEKDARAKLNEEQEREQLRGDERDEVRIIHMWGRERIHALLQDRVLAKAVTDDKGKTWAKKGRKLTLELLETLPWSCYEHVVIADKSVCEQVLGIVKAANVHVERVRTEFAERVRRLSEGDELLAGVIKMVKVYVAVKRKLQPGDKMAGRHGNKGVISRVLPEEDMPYLPDGTPVDMVLNPLGVPSRMNVGQILETHLGWAALGLGRRLSQLVEKGGGEARLRAELGKMLPDQAAGVKQLSRDHLGRVSQQLASGVPVATPVFDGAQEPEIADLLQLAGRDVSAQTVLFDGRTGEPFDQDVTVGVMYMLKLHHLVDEKIHARSIGPYSLVTQQPLGGKAQFGGQRLGEMEVWALEAYGAAHALQEFLTVKSDDVVGRTRMYEAIVKGEHVLASGVPESFHVLMKELQSLALDVELLDDVDPTYA